MWGRSPPWELIMMFLPLSFLLMTPLIMSTRSVFSDAIYLSQEIWTGGVSARERRYESHCPELGLFFAFSTSFLLLQPIESESWTFPSYRFYFLFCDPLWRPHALRDCIIVCGRAEVGHSYFGHEYWACSFPPPFFSPLRLTLQHPRLSSAVNARWEHDPC